MQEFWSIITTAWRMVIRRAAADWLILSAALITILLATTLLASGPIYADAVTLSGAHRTLEDAPVTDANVEISLNAPAAEVVDTGNRVRDIAMDTFAPTGGRIIRQITSESFALPRQPGPEVTDLAVFRYTESLVDNATLVDGDWPTPTDAPFETAIPSSTAAMLDLQIGDEIQMTSRRFPEHQPTVRVVGIYEVDDPSAPFWYAERLSTEGVDPGSSFTTFGPFIVPLETLVQSLSTAGAELNWRIFPDFDNLTVSEIGEFRRRVNALQGRLNAGQGAGDQFTVTTRLDDILSEAERSLLVTRSGVLILTVQLAILAGYALLLTAGLLIEQRRVETALLRSRGASTRQIVAMALMEGLLLTVPAAVAAPWLAALSLRILNSAGPLATINLTIDPVVTRPAYILAALAALASVAALTIPAWRSARALFTESYTDRGREKSRGLAQRAGIDIGLLVVAGLAFWQLRRYGAPITETVQGRLGIDPLLVAAPALGLLAGAIIALRSVPLIARAAEWIAAGGRSLVPALGAWQVARRPLRYARPALLLMLAVSIGLFAVSYTRTWTQSQADQANYQVGADLRVSPDRRIGSAIPQLNLPDAHKQVEGVTASMPVTRQFETLARSSGTLRYLALDSEQASEVVTFRPDLAGEPLPELMGRLADRRPELATVPLQGNPQRLGVELRLAVDPLPPDTALPRGVTEEQTELRPSADAVIQDGAGLLHRVALGEIPTNGEANRLTAPLSFRMENGEVAMPDYPLSLVAIEIDSPTPQAVQRHADLDLLGLSTSEQHSGNQWQPVQTKLNPDAWTLSLSPITRPLEPPQFSPRETQPERGIGTRLASGSTEDALGFAVTFALRPAGTELPSRLPILVSEQFLARTQTTIGDVIPVQVLPGPSEDAEIVGTIKEFPTIDPGSGEPAILDLPTLAMMQYEPGGSFATPEERWLAVDPGMSEHVAETLRREPYSSEDVFNRFDRAETLQSDPVALGTIGSLSLGFVAATIFAGLGFASSAAVSARERLTEFALLRALGLSSRQLAGWLSLEHGLLVLVSLIGGTLIGLLISWLVLPLISVTQEAATAVPAVIVFYPWLTILWLELAVLGVLAATVTVLVLLLRRLGLGSLLRLGEE